MNNIKHQIRVWANNETGKRARFTKEMFFPCFVPIGYDIIFDGFEVRVSDAEINRNCVIITSSSDVKYDAGELLREGFKEG